MPISNEAKDNKHKLIIKMNLNRRAYLEGNWKLQI